nr:leucine-rich repeat transmembrane neuronal protein 4-like [Lytechinus pictus]
MRSTQDIDSNFHIISSGRSQILKSILLLILVILQIDYVSMCPAGCVCTTYSLSGLRVDCSNAEHTLIPEDIPCSTILFILNDNLLQRVHQRAFPCQVDMLSLMLRNNVIKIVEEGSFENLRSLMELSFTGNRLIRLPSFRHCKDLINVNLSFNFLSGWPSHFSNESIYSLFLIRSNPFDHSYKKNHVVPYAVQFLDMSGVVTPVISSNSFSHPAHTLRLGMSSCGIYRVNPLSELSAIRFIILPYNRIRFIDLHAFRNLRDLIKLDLRHNNIRTIPVLSDLPSLQTINLNYNSISGAIEGALINVPSLESLLLLGNSIVNLIFIPPIPSLRGHILNENYLVGCLNLTQEVSYWPSIEIINVADNGLTGLNIGECSKVEMLRAENNFLRSVFFQHPMSCTHMTDIILDYNRIPNLLILNGLVNPEFISFRSNLVDVLDENMLMNMSNLQYLDLQKNMIRELIRLPVLPALQILDLSYNKILCIDETAFEFISLYHIDLSGNQLYRLTSFTGVPSLKSLYLDKNQLVNIFAEDVGEIPLLETLSIAGNGLATFPLLPHFTILTYSGIK